MKIINLIENLDDTYGGPAKSVPYLCKYLNHIGVDTEILSIKYHDNETNSLVDKYNLIWKSFKYNFIKKLRVSLDLKNYLNDNITNKDTILHTHNLWNFIPYVAYKMKKKYKIPLVVSIRGNLYSKLLKQNKLQKSIVWRLFQKHMLNNVSCIHVTEINELKAVRNLGITSPIAIIPNGISFDEFKTLKNKQDAKINLTLNLNKKYILFMSRLHPIKGIEYLVNAWIKLSTKYPNWDLLIVGPEYDSNYVDSIKQKINQYNLNNRVIFTGMLRGQNRLDAFSSSDLFVLPSHSENFGMVIAEAMVAKLPVITTHGTPWREIEEHDAGWWVELNQENIDNALEYALRCKDDELIQKGKNGFELIQKYEWKYQAKKMKQVYEWLLDKGNKPKFVFEDK